MPKFDKELLSNKEKPVLRTGTMEQDNTIATDNKKALSIYDLVNKNKKNKKVTMSATLDEELVNKLKSLSIELNSDVSKLLTEILTPFLADVEIKEENLNVYNDRNKKSRRKESK